MNQNQKKILEFLKDKDPSKFFSNEEIAKNTKLSLGMVGSECYKMRKEKLLEPSAASIGEQLQHRITVKGQNNLDEEELSIKNFNWTKIGTISAIVLSVIAIIISVLK